MNKLLHKVIDLLLLQHNMYSVIEPGKAGLYYKQKLYKTEITVQVSYTVSSICLFLGLPSDFGDNIVRDAHLLVKSPFFTMKPLRKHTSILRPFLDVLRDYNLLRGYYPPVSINVKKRALRMFKIDISSKVNAKEPYLFSISECRNKFNNKLIVKWLNEMQRSSFEDKYKRVEGVNHWPERPYLRYKKIKTNVVHLEQLFINQVSLDRTFDEYLTWTSAKQVRADFIETVRLRSNSRRLY